MKLFTFTKLFLKNIFDFKGRASRWEYWGGSILGGYILLLFLVMLYAATLYSFFGELISGILFIYIVIAAFSCQVRRLHDVGKSGWNLLWNITGIGALYNLFLFVQPSEPKNNKWGGVPSHIIYDSSPELTQNEIVDEEGQETPF